MGDNTIFLFNHRSKPFGILSNNAYYPIKIKQEEWGNITQYVKASTLYKKGDREKIRNIKNLNKINIEYKYLYDECIERTVKEAVNVSNRIKFQDQELKNLLLGTGDSKLVFFSDNKILGLNSDENYSQHEELDLSIKKLHELQGKILDVKKDLKFVKNKKNVSILKQGLKELQNEEKESISQIDDMKSNMYQNFMGINLHMIRNDLIKLEEDKEKEKKMRKIYDIYNSIKILEKNIRNNDILGMENLSYEEIIKKDRKDQIKEVVKKFEKKIKDVLQEDADIDDIDISGREMKDLEDLEKKREERERRYIKEINSEENIQKKKDLKKKFEKKDKKTLKKISKIKRENWKEIEVKNLSERLEEERGKIKSKDISDDSAKLILDQYKKNILYNRNIIDLELENPGSLVKIIRKNNLRKLREKLFEQKRNKIFKSYMTKLISEKFPDVSPDKIDKIIYYDFETKAKRDGSGNIIKEKLNALYDMNVLDIEIDLPDFPSLEDIELAENFDPESIKIVEEELPLKLQEEKEEEELPLEKEKVVFDNGEVICLSMDGCRFCDDMMEQKKEFDQLLKEFGVKITFLKESEKKKEFDQLVKKHNIELFPHCIILENNEVIGDISGSKTPSELVEKIKKYKGIYDSINKYSKILKKMEKGKYKPEVVDELLDEPMDEPIVKKQPTKDIIEFSSSPSDNYFLFSPSYFKNMMIINGFEFPTVGHYILFRLLLLLKGPFKNENINSPVEAHKILLIDPEGESNPGNFDTLENIDFKYRNKSTDYINNTVISAAKMATDIKFSNTELQYLLKDTGDYNLVNNDYQDPILGTGPPPDFSGGDWTGKYLTELRKKYKKLKPRENEEKLLFISSFLNDDKDLLNWINKRLENICKSIAIVVNYIGDTNEWLFPGIVKYVINDLYLPCDLNNIMKVKINKVLPPPFEDLVKEYFKNSEKEVQSKLKLEKISHQMESDSIFHIWKYISLLVYGLVDYIAQSSNSNVIKVTILNFQNQLSQNFNCEKIIDTDDKFENCIVSALINLINKLLNCPYNMHKRVSPVLLNSIASILDIQVNFLENVEIDTEFLGKLKISLENNISKDDKRITLTDLNIANVYKMILQIKNQVKNEKFLLKNNINFFADLG